jgi:uncharacterized protein YbjT (DUF2867 family)
LKILVTGGTGVIGRAAVTELLRRRHEVRLLSRGAAAAADAWDAPVEPFAGNVADAESLRGAADGCDAVLHIAGIIEESPPELTFQRVNIDGTANLVRLAEQAGVHRFVHVSSLGTDRGRSAYHRSKAASEEVVRCFAGSWCVVRTGAVIGPRDQTVSVLLRMMRTLPAVPVIDSGDQQFQPVWHEDAAWALAECVERDDVAGRVLRIAGPDVVTVREVLDIFGEVTDRDPIRLPLPSFLARIGTAVISAAGVETPVTAATVQMLLEGNYLRDGEANDLTGLLGATPEPLRSRLVQLVDELPEQMPAEGVGRLQRRRFVVDIHGSRLSGTALLDRFRDRFASIVPFEAAAEPGSPQSIELDATLTLQLPARGHVQVRVEQLDERSVTLVTLEGHPLAGIVRFRSEDRSGDAVRFTIDVVERAASRVDQLSMALIGSAAQRRTWMRTAENVVTESGGTAPGGVEEESWSLDDEAAEPIDEWARDLVQSRERRTENRV